MLICQECGLVEFFDGDHAGMDSLMSEVETETGYKINDHWLQLFGICENCKKKQLDR